VFKKALLVLLVVMFFPIHALAGEDPIKSAESAAFTTVSSQATIMSWDDKVLRKGTSGWTCLPDRDTPGNDPWCVNDAWMNFLTAYKSKTKPSYNQVGLEERWSVDHVGRDSLLSSDGASGQRRQIVFHRTRHVPEE
jgi:hypothetical protein